VTTARAGYIPEELLENRSSEWPRLILRPDELDVAAEGLTPNAALLPMQAVICKISCAKLMLILVVGSFSPPGTLWLTGQK
jgi:hypothetical protein